MNHPRDNEPFRQALGARVRELRLESERTLDDLADMTDLSKVGIWEIEKGRNEPRASTLWRLARALGCTIDYLVTGEGS